MWLGINLEKNTVNLHSVDATSILPFIRGRDFQIVEMMGYKDNIEKNLLRENEERFWVRKNHYIEISGLIEGNEGIYMVEVISKTTPKIPEDVSYNVTTSTNKLREMVEQWYYYSLYKSQLIRFSV